MNNEKRLDYSVYFDKLYGCFIGKTVVGTLGAPFEGIKMPMELEFQREMIDAMLPNDDLDLQVLWLDVVEKYGDKFTSYELLYRFCENCDYSPGEYAVMRKNYQRGIYPPLSGKFCNDYYTQGMGCPIRSEIWACLAPANPAKAAEYASRDGIIDHDGESVYAERFLAALESAAFVENDLDTLIKTGLEYVPSDSKFYGLVNYTLELCEKYDDVKLILRKLLFRYGHPDCTNMFQNMGITLIALLKGDLDLIKTGMDALNCGFDTDCTCASAGAVVGLLRGAKSIISEYKLPDEKFVLGVRSDRRSNRVFDLCEDIARLGSFLNSGTVKDAPSVHYEFEYHSLPFEFTVTYENDDPTFYPGHDCNAVLTVRNFTDSVQHSVFHIHGVGIDESFSLSLAAGESAHKKITVVFPVNDHTVYDKNMINVDYNYGEQKKQYTFGVVGAMPWKVIGPFWRTEPVCNTKLLLDANLKYWDVLSPYAKDYKGDFIDIVRDFHLNMATDTETEYILHDSCFTPYDANAIGEYEENVFYQTQDSINFSDICGFAGPSVLYLARELVSPEDMDVCVQIGNSSPFTLWINDDEIAKRDKCDNWDAENVHVRNIKLHKGINRILFRLTKVNGDAKFSLIFSNGATCADHYTCFGANRPEYFRESKI